MSEAKRPPSALDVVLRVLDDRKALDVESYPAAEMSNGLFDWLVVCTGTSQRHIKGIASEVSREVKRSRRKVVGSEGTRDSEWVLLDLGEVVLHVMTRSAREYYDIDSLWSFGDRPPK